MLPPTVIMRRRSRGSRHDLAEKITRRTWLALD
jgi:hypothetical protein